MARRAISGLLVIAVFAVAAKAEVPARAQGAAGHGAAGHGGAVADQRADTVLGGLSLDEKLALINGEMPLMLRKEDRPADLAIGAGFIPGNPAHGIPPQIATDAGLGVGNLMDMRKGDVATAMPSGLAQASTWNPGILRDGGRMIGSEARAKGFNILLAGGVNLVRDPRAGRNFEYLGEDPLLAGRLVGAQIAGIQSNGILSTIKHFALNDQETGRSSASVEMDESAMRESDLLAFQIGIETGDPGSVMCAYNLVGGKFACENDFLLNQVLRRDWGFKGYVMSDWGSVHSTESLLAGLDQQSAQKLDRKRWFSTELRAALADGRVSPAAVDQAVRRILRTLFAKGLDRLPAGRTQIDYAANALVARRAAEEGTVLLKNAGGLLPLARSVRRIAVIGGNADIGVLHGAGSSQVTPVGGFAKVEPIKSGPAANFGRRAYGGAAPLAALRAAMPDADIRWIDGSNPAAAAELARQADVAIVFGEKFSAEAVDSPDLALDFGGDQLIEQVARANSRTVAVLQTGNPVLMPWLERVGAVVALWYPGQQGAEALAGILNGAVNPSGRLPVTFPAGVEQLPNPVLPGSDLPPPDKEIRATYGINANSRPFAIHYPEGSDAGYRWFDRTSAQPLFAFGHGLSYTSFSYDRVRVRGGKSLTVRFRVTNTGKRAGADVPQVYVTLPGKARRLAGWDKVTLAPGESRMVSITAEPRILASYDAVRRGWTIPAGAVRIEVSRAANAPVLTRHTRLTAHLIRP